jgi:RHS repeat-associated protein
MKNNLHHLGNLRALIRDNSGDVELLAWADYDPWGMELPGRCGFSSQPYRYAYQGQFAERNSITQNLDFMLRSYDPRIGRFTTPDPFAQDFSPYSGMGNNPVAMVH